MSGRLPTFIGIGAAKCGTTSIHRYLGEHPEILVSKIKETNFFAYQGQTEARFRVRSWDAYRRQFAGARDERAIGEFSPLYMDSPEAARRAATRIAEALPGAKLLVSLRSPAERAYSRWVAARRSGIERRPADIAIQRGTRHVEPGFYRQRLQPYLELFPSEQIKIMIFEEFLEAPTAAMQEIYRFLDVDPTFEPSVEARHNRARVPRHPRLNYPWERLRRLQPRWFSAPAPLVRLNRALLERTYTEPPPLDPALRSRLLELYREEVAGMEDLLGRELTMWKR
jgi:hypothetical protein